VGTQEQRNSRYRETEEQWVQRNNGYRGAVGAEEQRNSGYAGTEEQ